MILATLPYPHIDPVLVHLGPLRHPLVRAWPISPACCWPGGASSAPSAPQALWTHPPFNGKPPATEDQIGDLVVWATLGVILGGRLGWVLIYGTILCSVSPDYADFCRRACRRHSSPIPLSIIAAWEGGMSFHGGLLGVVIAVWLFCRRHKLKMLPIADLACAFAPIGLFFGRLANFVNGELWGRVTDVPWAMVFPRAGPSAAPSQPTLRSGAGRRGAVPHPADRAARVPRP